MPGILSLETLLGTLTPTLAAERYVFCTVPSPQRLDKDLAPLAIINEQEGTTLVLTEAQACDADISFDTVFRQITLSVHSSLTAVGLTAAVATALAEIDISANVIAAYYHDHIFVPEGDAEQAMRALHQLSEKSRAMLGAQR